MLSVERVVEWKRIVGLQAWAAAEEADGRSQAMRVSPLLTFGMPAVAMARAAALRMSAAAAAVKAIAPKAY